MSVMPGKCQLCGCDPDTMHGESAISDITASSKPASKRASEMTTHDVRLLQDEHETLRAEIDTWRSRSKHFQDVSNEACQAVQDTRADLAQRDRRIAELEEKLSVSFNCPRCETMIMLRPDPPSPAQPATAAKCKGCEIGQTARRWHTCSIGKFAAPPSPAAASVDTYNRSTCGQCRKPTDLCTCVISSTHDAAVAKIIGELAEHADRCFPDTTGSCGCHYTLDELARRASELDAAPSKEEK